MITDETRDRIRALQDEILDRMDKLNISYNMRVSRDMPSEITGIKLISYIYPEYESELRNVLSYLKEE